MVAKKGRCLVAEDDGMTMKFISRTLEKANYEILKVVSDGEKAVEAMMTLEPDFVVMDLDMPRMSGIEAAHQITAARSIPIIMVSGHQDRATIDRARAAGVSTYLTKPFLAEELLEAVQTMLERFQAPEIEN